MRRTNCCCCMWFASRPFESEVTAVSNDIYVHLQLRLPKALVIQRPRTPKIGPQGPSFQFYLGKLCLGELFCLGNLEIFIQKFVLCSSETKGSLAKVPLWLRPPRHNFLGSRTQRISPLKNLTTQINCNKMFAL